VITSTLALAPGFGATLGRGVGAIVLYAIVGVLLLLVGFYAIDLTTPGKLNRLVRAGLPNAVTITSAGMISMAFIVVVAVFSAGGALADGLIYALVFGLLGIVVQVLGVRLLEWAAGVNMSEVITSPTFSPVSVVIGSTHIALGLVVAVSIS
jgi:hypothetical protein